MTTRRITTENGESKEQELNKLASLLKDFCNDAEFDKNVAEASEWADGYNQALNTIESLINTLPGYMVAS